jgi:Rad3-related DNA helicase
VLKPAHGVVVTSATLRGGEDWSAAEARSGARHLARPAQLFAADSPFDYAANSEVLIVTDLKRGDLPALSGAYARLIEAAGGGTLGLFTAIQRLRAVHARIADRLARAGLPLYAQHVDPIDTGTLVDIFRMNRAPACSAPMPCATASTSPAIRCGWWSWKAFPGRAPPCSTPPAAPPAAAALMTTGWCAPGSPRPLGA